MGAAEEKLKELTRHSNVKLTDRCNSAILAAISIAKQLNPKRKIILIPDQGGWISFQKYPKRLGLAAVKVKTDRGIIDLKDLEKKSKTAAAFLVTSFAGYFAEQDIKAISKICRNNKCLLIEDASGAVSDKTLCNGEYSDLIVASFGRWKPVNLGNGGFISSGISLENAEEILKTKVFKGDEKKLREKLDDSSKRIEIFSKTAEKVKQELEKEIKGIDIFHRKKRGLNVIAGFRNEREKDAIIDYCKRNKYEHVLCPRYIRVEEDAVSIEIKRM